MASEARAKAKMYEKVEKELEEKIEKISDSLKSVKETLENADDTFVNGNGEAEGKIMTTFIHKESLWSMRYKKVLSEMESGVVTLKLRKAEAAQLKTYWEMQAEIEEMKTNVGF